MDRRNLDPWADGPRRGVFVTPTEAADPVLHRAAQSDPARAWVTISPGWLWGVVGALSGLHDDVVAGEADPADVCTALQMAAADLYAVSVGYPGAGAVDLSDPALTTEVAQFLDLVLEATCQSPVGLLACWAEAIRNAVRSP